VKRDWHQDFLRQEAEVKRPSDAVTITSIHELLRPSLHKQNEFEAHIDFAFVAASEFQRTKHKINGKDCPTTFSELHLDRLTAVGSGSRPKRTVDYLRGLVRAGCNEKELVSLAWLVASAFSYQNALSLPRELRSTLRLKGLLKQLKLMLACKYLNPRLLSQHRELPPYWLRRDFDAMAEMLAEYLRLVDCVARAGRQRCEDSWHHFHICRLGTHVEAQTGQPVNWEAFAQLINAMDGRRVSHNSLRKTYERCKSI
jgi:hypothetical protein